MPPSVKDVIMTCPSLLCNHSRQASSVPMLVLTGIFSYADTQRHRLGPNYLLLPVNAPK